MSTTACATTCSATVPLKKDCGEPAHRRSRTVHSAKQSVLHKGWSVRISSNAGAGKGGTIEESAKGLNSTVAVFPLMIMLMLIIFMVQLQSFQKMFLVISVAPLGLIGVVMALLPTHTPMGFVAILGIIALSGMIIRNSVILIDQIDMDLARGLHPWDAVIDATTHRLRPIVLTAAAASLGMIPIASEVFWGPMAYAIIGGLFVATLLTLLFLPALYVAWFRIKEPRKEPEPRLGAGVPAAAK